MKMLTYKYILYVEPMWWPQGPCPQPARSFFL